MSDLLVTEFKEQVKEGQMHHAPVLNGEDFDQPEELVVTFIEEPPMAREPLVVMDPEGLVDGVVEFSEDDDFEVDSDEILMGPEDTEAMGFRLPGATNYVEDEEEEEEDEEEEKETSWEQDRDVAKFMEYILQAYPAGIPSHDGTSTLGCERAVLYLTNLNKEISEALRSDKDDVLDLDTLEKVRVNMVRDVVTLKDHVRKLNKKLKKAEDTKDSGLIKEATTPKVQLIMSPFERAVTGIIINSVVSSGKPFEDVYDFLKKKYAFDDREELTIMQLLMDMGHPIFKDRGTIGETKPAEDGQGVDFIKNYFA